MLAGSVDLVKSDRVIIRFLETEFGRKVDGQETLLILQPVTFTLLSNHPQLTPGFLDYAYGSAGEALVQASFFGAPVDVNGVGCVHMHAGNGPSTISLQTCGKHDDVYKHLPHTWRSWSVTTFCVPATRENLISVVRG